MKTILTFVFSLLITHGFSHAQTTDANIFGDVKSNGDHIPFVSVYIEGTTMGVSTDETGHYYLTNMPAGTYLLVAKAMGYQTARQKIEVVAHKTIEVNFELIEEGLDMDEVVVTGTKTFKRRTESAVIVNVIDKKLIASVQACNLSEGLRFQPGLRVETDCQTCSYTQLRMNGLGGSYSQILINSRPIFSPLVGLYGMEQIPANMIERIEVVRGGGSALYGANAIGGTVNIITQLPTSNSYEAGYSLQNINGRTNDQTFQAALTLINKKRNTGMAFFANRRHREAYDHPGRTLLPDATTKTERDHFSELPLLRTNSFGGNLFFEPTDNQKIEINFSSLYEYRYGGDINTTQAYLAQQAEERTHYILMGGVDYELHWNERKSTLIAYVAAQSTRRNHYTGLYPDPVDFTTPEDFEQAELNHLKNPPYGTTQNHTIQGGLQFNHSFHPFLVGTNVVTLGAEILSDDVVDSIPAYQYGTNQQTLNSALFAQSDWKLNPSLTFLAGLRADKHNLLSKMMVSPRLSVLYRLKSSTQFRLTWGTGFRAPQSFDTDMHIAFAGGGISRISLADDLKEERSQSWSGSVNCDYPTEKLIAGFTLEGFYTKLTDAFYLHPTGTDEYGEHFEKRNGPGAVVQGITLELRVNYNRKIQAETGFTLQKSQQEQAVAHIDNLPPVREFLRTPNQYGYWTLTATPFSRWNLSLNGVYTGPMKLAKFSANPALEPNQYVTSRAFHELSTKVSYTFPVSKLETALECFAGVKNLTNTYQDDFDNGKFRDSNYVYGPGAPRTIYFGILLKAL